MLIDQVRAFCRLHGLLPAGSLVVAVSGGADSLALLHILHMLSSEFGITLHAATFDHGIRGAAGADDVRFVQDVAGAWGIPVSVGGADVPALAQQWSLGVEAAARKARYSFLAQIADQIGARVIATGHNRDDQAETVLMHVIRGAGLGGLRGMLPAAPLPDTEHRSAPLTVVRPLLMTPRADIDDYIRTLGIQPRNDATNADTRYTRNRIRHEILPLLESINPEVRAALARTAELARDDAAALAATIPALTSTPNGLTISRREFLALMTGQQRFLLREAALRLSPDVELSADRIEGALAVIREREHGARVRLGGAVWVTLTSGEAGGALLITDESQYPGGCPWMLSGAPLALEMPTKEPGVYALPGSQWQLTIQRADGHSVPDDPLSAVIAIPAGARLELRTRARADRFRPQGAGGHSQKLSDTFINMKILAAWRDRIPLLTLDDEIIWFVAPTNSGSRSRLSSSATRAGIDLWLFAFSQR